MLSGPHTFLIVYHWVLSIVQSRKFLILQRTWEKSALAVLLPFLLVTSSLYYDFHSPQCTDIAVTVIARAVYWSFISLHVRHLLYPLSDPFRNRVEKSWIISSFNSHCSNQVCLDSERSYRYKLTALRMGRNMPPFPSWWMVLKYTYMV